MPDFDWDDAIDERTARRPRGTFTASFDSTCPECYEPIEAGDEAAMRDGRAVCLECVEGGWA